MSFERVNVQDEIDLLELLRSLWRGKWFIVFMASMFVGAATIYLAFKKPIYQAKITLISPISADIAALNFGRSFTSELKPITPADAYIIFRGVLLADSTILFFKKNNTLKPNTLISITVKPYMLGNSVIVEATSKQSAVEAANQFVAMTERIALDKLNATLIKEINEAALHIKNQMNEIHESAIKEKDAQLIRLQEALQIAQAINLKQPMLTSNNTVYSDASNPAYLRGSEALAAEINSLEKRSSNDAFNLKLQQLQEQYSVLQNVNKVNKNVSLSRMDGELVLFDTSASLNRKRVILLAGMLGSLLGVSFLLLCQIKMLKKCP